MNNSTDVIASSIRDYLFSSAKRTKRAFHALSVTNSTGINASGLHSHGGLYTRVLRDSMVWKADTILFSGAKFAYNIG